MKKSLSAILTSAIVLGVAGTSFAAANPFSDVPTDHWAYDAVSQLAKDGVVDGYGDTTFKGGNAITRYEMAQIVAKAMAKEDQANAADKAMIDKLAAEFSGELNNLGVRVSNLEKKVDGTKWDGVIRWRAQKLKDETNGGGTVKSDYNKTMFRLNTDSAIGDTGWHAKTRTEYTTDNDSSKNNMNGVMDRAYVEGPLFGGKAFLGKYPVLSYDVGFMMDNRISGGGVEWTKGKVTGRVDFGRMGTAHLNNSENMTSGWSTGTAPAVSFQSAQLKYQASKATELNGQIYHMNGGDLDKVMGKDSITMAAIGFRTKFANDFVFATEYSRGNASQYNNLYRPYVGGSAMSFDTNNPNKTGWLVNLSYKGGQLKKPHSYGAWIAYKQMPQTATVSETYVDEFTNQKGWEAGFEYVPMQNVMTRIQYFDGRDVNDSNAKRKIFRGQVEFYF